MNDAFARLSEEARRKTFDLFRENAKNASFDSARAWIRDPEIDDDRRDSFLCCPFGAALYFDERFVDRVAREPSLFVPPADRLSWLLSGPEPEDSEVSRLYFAAADFIDAWDLGKLSFDGLAVALGVDPTT
jgi:hypothetical protein